MKTIEFFVDLLYLYFFFGVVFAALFLWRGVALIDEAAQGISWKTRALLFPGSVALWPVLWRKWRKTARQMKTATTNETL